MTSQLEKPKDIVSGVLVMGIGAGFLYFGRNLTIGTASRMGAGYFPVVLSLLMMALGIAITINALRGVAGEAGPISIPWRQLGLIFGSIILFAVTLTGLGLFVALFVCTLIATMASIYSKLLPSVLLAFGLSIFSVLIFVYTIGLPVPVFGRWLSLEYWFS